MADTREPSTKAGAPGNERMNSFSDGVFAIVITLLVLEIKVPELQEGLVAHELAGALADLLPRIVAHVVSFAVLGIYWVGHHTTFLYVRRHDRTLLWLNVLFLLFVASMPFPTALLSRYPDQPLAMSIFCAVLIGAGVVADIMWWYAAQRKRLAVASLTADIIALVHRRIRIAPAMYAVAIGVGYFNMTLSWCIVAAAVLVYLIPNPITDPHRHHAVDD